MSSMHKYLVSNNTRITPSTLLLTLSRPPGVKEPFKFQPGQYAAISFKRRGRPTPARCFSIVSSPLDENKLEFSMRTNGRYTGALAELKPGDEVNVRGPFGGFVLDPIFDKDVVLLAGGIGVTPFMSMLNYATGARLNNKITLIYSCRNQEEVPFLNQLNILKQQNPNIDIIYAVSVGPIDKLVGNKVVIGRISNQLIEKVANNGFAYKIFFICGPSPFMKSMTSLLADKDVPKANIRTEAFSQGPLKQTGKIRSWPFNFYILSAIGVAVGSFAVMISDLIKTLPADSLLSANTTTELTAQKNARQTDLDQLVNGLPVLNSTAPPTNGVTSAIQKSTTSSTQSTTTQSPTVTTPTVTVPSSTPAPVPVHIPKCTTSQSGIKTCV